MDKPMYQSVSSVITVRNYFMQAMKHDIIFRVIAVVISKFSGLPNIVLQFLTIEMFASLMCF